MIIGRSIVGLAVGAGSFVAPLYISELAPTMWRGRLVVLNVLFITLGQVVAYIVGWAFVEWGSLETGWRWMVGLGAVPAAVQILVMLFMPETPRWLIQVGRVDEGRGVLSRVFGKGTEMQKVVDEVLKGIEREVREEDEAKRSREMARKTKGSEDSWVSDAKDSWEELIGVGGNRRALTIACLLQGLQQLCGFVSTILLSSTNSTNLNLLEFSHVLQRHNLHNCWVLVSNSYISLRRTHKFHPDLCRSHAYRPHRSSSYPPHFNPHNGYRAPPLLHRLPLHGSPFYPLLHYHHILLHLYHPHSTSHNPNSNNALYRSLRPRSRKRAMDAIRALSPLSSFPRLFSLYLYKLVRKLHHRTYISANDGTINSDVDICCVCGGMRGWMVGDLVRVPGDEGFGIRRGEVVVEGWVGC